MQNAKVFRQIGDTIESYKSITETLRADMEDMKSQMRVVTEENSNLKNALMNLQSDIKNNEAKVNDIIPSQLDNKIEQDFGILNSTSSQFQLQTTRSLQLISARQESLEREVEQITNQQNVGPPESSIETLTKNLTARVTGTVTTCT